MGRAALFAACLCLMGCAVRPRPPGQPLVPATPLVGTEWTATDIGGELLTLAPVARGPKITIDAAANRFSGNAGCNSISGTFTRQEQNVRFTDVIATRMACPALDIETRFLAALDTVHAHRITGNRLELLDANGVVRLRLRAAR